MKNFNCLKLFKVIFSTLMFNSCTIEQECEIVENDLLTYKIIENISIPVQSLQYNYESTFIVTTNNDSITYGGYDSYFHKIDFFDLKTSTYIKSINLSKEGPNSVNDVSSVYYHSTDSIILAQSGYHTIYLINSKAEIIRKWDDFTQTEAVEGRDYSGEYGVGAIDRYGMELFLLPKKKLLTHFFPVSKNKDNERVTLYDMPSIAILDLVNGQLSELTGRYPVDYRNDKVPRTYFISYCTDRLGNVTVAYPSSDYLYSSKTKAYHCITSNYYAPRKQTKYNESDGSESEELYQSFEREGAYTKIIYDPYRSCYYVVAKHAIKADMDYYDKFASDWSIIKMDENYNIIGESKFTKKKYDFTNIEVVPLGLMISKENPLNPKNRENFIEFDIIKI